MKKLFLLIIIIFICSLSYGASEWSKSEVAGTRSVSDIDTYMGYNNDALDRLLANYITMKLVYNSVAQLTVSVGEVTCSNTDGSVRKMRKNPSTTTVTWADIDTGAEAGSTTYYVYAVADADAETATFLISANSSTPTGATSYKRIGSFYNDGSSNITLVANDTERVVLSAGTIANAATISLPSGWSSDECQWTVGAGTLSDLSGSGAIDEITVSVNSSRVVTCTYNQLNWVDGNTNTAGTCTANYIIGCTR